MGSGVFEMSAVLGAKGSGEAKKMKNGGALFFNAQKAEGTGHLKLTLNGISLTNTEELLRKMILFMRLRGKIMVKGKTIELNRETMFKFYEEIVENRTR